MRKETTYADYATQFVLHQASWVKDKSQLPDRWYTETTETKPTWQCHYWYSSNRGADETTLTQLRQLTELLSKNNLGGYRHNFTGLPIEEGLPRVTEQNTSSEDCIFIFYCGIGIRDQNGTILPYVDSKDRDSQYLWRGFEQYVRKTEAHIFLVTDIREIQDTKDTLTPLSFPGAQKMVMLQTVSNSIHDGYFFGLFKDTVKQTGANIRYSDLITRIHLRYYQDNRKDTPMMDAYEKGIIKTWLFSGRVPYAKNKKVFYNETVSGWVVDSGLADGVTPSLEFMDTLLQLEDGTRVKVTDVSEAYSVVEGIGEAEKENTFDAFFLQKALPKICVAFHPQLSHELRQSFENAATRHGLHFIHLVTDIALAGFVINSSNNDAYILTYNNEKQQGSERPLFFPQRNSFEFIKQIEYIAQWYAVLQLDNPQNKIPSDDYDIVVECIEGQNVTEDNKADVWGRVYIDPKHIELRYRSGFQPAFRCSVKMKSSGNPAQYYVNFLYLDSTYGILNFLPTENGLLQADKTIGLEGGLLYTTIDEYYTKNQITEIQDFLFAFISREPVDLLPLVQSNLQFEKETLRSANIATPMPQRKTFILPQSDWTVKKIPIRIFHNGLSFEQTVNELNNSRRTTVPGDLQKNRWGRRPLNNGFAFTATVVEKTMLSLAGFYEVLLEITNTEHPVADGSAVAILLHDSFPNPVRFLKFENGKAGLTVTAYEDFTAAAVLYDGTELELDLSEVPGLPDKFYSYRPDDQFRQKLASLLNEKKKTISVPDDLQKNRWGGTAQNNGWLLQADVTKEQDTHRVTLTVQCSPQKKLEQQVAFLLHDSFGDKQTVYAKASGGVARCSFSSYEAFTVGVYISDGTELELNLNEQKGFPASFYYAVNG